MAFLKRWVFAFTIVLLACSAVEAQQATEAPGEPVRARLAQLALDAPDLELFIDGVRYGDEPFPAGIVSEYDEFAAGTYTVALARAESKGNVVGPEDITLEAGHVYTLAVLGQFADNDLRFRLIDETAAFPNVKTTSTRILIHNLKGAPPIDMVVNGKTLVSNLAYGEITTVEQPVGDISSVEFVATGDPETVIFQGSVPHFYAGTTYFLALSGKYPGEVFTDFFPLSAFVYMGDVMARDGGAISVGAEASGELTNVGERVTYSLDLKQSATLDIVLAAATDSTIDAYIRLYDADGNLIAENDELDFEDNPTDAGLLGQALAAGTYTVEAASWGDALPGTYVLKVAEAAQ